MQKRKLFWLFVSIAQIILSIVVSQSFALDSAKVKAIGLLCASLTLWITETLPMSIATLLLVFSMPFLDLMTYNDILSNFGLNTSLFIMASSGIAIAIAKSNLPKMIISVIFLSSVLLIIKPTTEKIVVQKQDYRLTTTDIIVLIVTTLVIIGWFLSSFVTFLNTTSVAIWGLVILFLPFIEVLDIDMFGRGVNWDLVLTMGFVSVLMTGIAGTGVISDFANFIFGEISQLPILIVLAILSLTICVIRAFVPTTTAVVALLAPVLFEISCITSITYTSLLLIAAFWAAAALLLIFTEPIYLITYKEKYYSQKDLLEVGAIPSILGGTIITILIWFLSSFI